ncbi:HAD family hydrolase [Bacillus sp. Marseille-Q1617]|uniref:HAD family hydrolase n=1 Tax=Bacillus sp. Marseille-Q1617 TaxID=2736887 RepID=UPI0015888684|nr:HAD family hydrolase [Bacillus sp. Marseille-Q1617]
MKKHTLLLFDLDGTLLGSEWFKEGIIKTIQSHALTINIDADLFLQKKLSVPLPLLNKFKNREMTPCEFRRARWKHAFSCFDMYPDQDTVDEFHECFLTKGMSCIKEDVQLNSIMNELQAHYHLGIVTNALYDPIKKISCMNLSHVFKKEAIFQAEELGYRKPDPELYTAALSHFDASPDQTIFIGDSWDYDVVAPIKMGMDAIWLNAGNASPPTAHKPLEVIREITELRTVLLNN